MNCDQYWDLCTSDDETDQAAAERHLVNCPNCQLERQAVEAALAPLANHPPLGPQPRQRWLAVAAQPAERGQPAVPAQTRSSAIKPRGPLSWMVPVITTVAALVLAIMVLNFATSYPVTDLPGSPSHILPIARTLPPTYSPITIVPLNVTLCFGQIEQDLQASAARAEEISESVALIEVERDLRETLQRAHRWGN